MEKKAKGIAEVLHDIQTKLKAPKTRRNAFANFNYRNSEDILEAVKPLLPDGFVVLVTDEVTLIGERYYIKAEAVLSDGDKTIKTYGFARETAEKKGMDEAQITGSASSYARKYALNGLFAIDDNEDVDSGDNTPSETKTAPAKVVEASKPKLDTTTGKYIATAEGSAKSARFFAAMAELGISGEKAKEYVKTKAKLASYTDITKMQLEGFLRTAEAKLKEKETDPLNGFDGGLGIE